MTITLPDSLRTSMEIQASANGFGSVEAYVGALVEADLRRFAKVRLEQSLLDGLNSGPATEITPQDWEEIRREVLATIRARQTA